MEKSIMYKLITAKINLNEIIMVKIKMVKKFMAKLTVANL